MVDSTQIQGPYGSERLPVPNLPEGVGQPADVVQQDGPRVSLSAGMQSASGVQAATAARDVRAAQEDATVLETIGAAISTWDTTRMIQRFGRPAFDEDTKDFNQHEYLQGVPRVLTEDQLDWFLGVAKGPQSAAWAMQRIEDIEMAERVVGNSPIVGTATQFLDPAWMAIPPAFRVGRMTGVAGRATSGVAAGALTGAVAAGREGPTSTEEIVLGMVLGSAAGAVFFKGGKLVKRNPDFPEQEAIEIATDIQVEKATAAAKPRYKLVSPEVWDEIQIPAKEATFKWEQVPEPKVHLPSGLNGGVRHGVYPVQFKNPLDRVAYEVTSAPKGDHAAVAKRSARVRELTEWAKAQGVAAEELVARGQAIRAELSTGGKTTKVTQGSKVVAKGEARIVEDSHFKGNPAAPQGKPKMRRVLDQVAEPARTERRKVKDAVYAEVPQELSPAVAPSVDAATIVNATEKALVQNSEKAGLGKKFMWNMHKTMEGYGPVGKKIADLIYDNNSNLGLNSVESHREAILSDLRHHQYEYEDLMRQTMAARGFGTFKMLNPFTSRQAYEVQQQVEREVQRELFRREQAARLGQNVKSPAVPKEIAEMADKIDNLHKLALKEMKAAGVEGAENLLERPGYLNRRWSAAKLEDIITRLEGKGVTRELAVKKLNSMVSLAVRRANPRMDQKVSDQIGHAIIDRALRRGVFEDAVFNAPGSPSAMAELRDVLKSSGLDHADVERALDVLRVETDEAGKQSFMKHRLDLDYRAQVQIGDEVVSVMDLIDNRVSTLLDQYTKQVSTQAAFARNGLRKPSDIENLRTELAASVPMAQRKEAVELFNDTIAHLRGDPSGAKVNEKFRLYQAYGRAIALAWSGLWQTTEYANMVGAFGLRKTLKYAMREIPGFKDMMRPDADTARSLNNVLAEHSVASLRLRPFIAKYEDGFDMDMGSAMQLSSQPMGQLIPFANAMRFVHHHQAKLVGNLILDRVDQAARGNAKAAENLRKYGIEYHVMDKLSGEIQKHGFNVDAWDDAVWASVRPAFAKMMDATVLKSRLGDIPAFAAFDQVGKLLFTYRTFVLTAHNKVLAGGLERNGAGALGLVLMYQLPLTLAAIQAQSLIKGEGLLEEDEVVQKALGQMGALGLLTEPFKWATGESNSVGATYLIPADRGVKLFQNTVQGDAGAAATTSASMLPVVAAVPFFKGVGNLVDDKE